MTEKDIINIISHEAGVPASKINMNTTLLGDLNIDGDDAYEVIEKIHAMYKPDLSKFIFKDYFREEPCFKGLIYLLRLLKYKDTHKASNKKPMTVSMLVQACSTGEWQ